MSTFARVAELPLDVDGYSLERLEQDVSSGFTRVTTVVRLEGGGQEGVGEDVTYAAAEHDSLQALGPVLPLAGRWTLASLSARLDELELFAAPPEQDAARLYRRWAFESAALDLALRQAGLSLAGALGRDPRPVTFVVSLRLGEPPRLDALERWLDVDGSLRFKLDPTSDWDDSLVGALDRLGVVETVDLKGAYRGTVVDQPPDAELYARVAEGLPRAWIEDPALTPETEPVLARHRDRITWDAPIHSAADIEALAFRPRMLNVKPSRFGSIEALLAAYDHCAARGIGTYGGGQFELGPGRGQIQYLAALFSPDAPNDVAPGAFNAPAPAPGLPASPLAPAPAATGFRWNDRRTTDTEQ